MIRVYFFLLIQKKKEGYLDSLIANTFSAKERVVINEKIAEFGLQEKQLKAEIFKAELKRTEIEETRLSMADFKQAISTLKLNR